MKERMQKGDLVLFYHSNCKTPGIAGLAEIYREGYPDFTAFDSSHPYYDPKSDESKPTWFMVDVKFVMRLPHFVPLRVLQDLTNNKLEVPDYISTEDLQSIKAMPLLNRGRLSVQPVSSEAFEAIRKLGLNGGWSSSTKLESKKLKPSSDETKSAPVEKPPSHKRKSSSTNTHRGQRKRTQK